MNFIDFGEELVWVTRLCGQFACEIRYNKYFNTTALFTTSFHPPFGGLVIAKRVIDETDREFCNYWITKERPRLATLMYIVLRSTAWLEGEIKL